MASALELDCPCGAKVSLDSPQPGQSSRCSRCGAEFMIAGEEPQLTSDAVAIANDPDLADPELRCDACGGAAEIAYKGPGGRDRLLVCSYCRTAVDLPEARGTSEETRIERPGETIHRRTTRWEGVAPELPDLRTGNGERLANHSQVVEETVDLDLDPADLASPERLKARLRASLPEDMVDSVFADLTRQLGAARSHSGSPRANPRASDGQAARGFFRSLFKRSS